MFRQGLAGQAVPEPPPYLDGLVDFESLVLSIRHRLIQEEECHEEICLFTVDYPFSFHTERAHLFQKTEY